MIPENPASAIEISANIESVSCGSGIVVALSVARVIVVGRYDLLLLNGHRFRDLFQACFIAFMKVPISK